MIGGLAFGQGYLGQTCPFYPGIRGGGGFGGNAFAWPYLGQVYGGRIEPRGFASGDARPIGAIRSENG